MRGGLRNRQGRIGPGWDFLREQPPAWGGEEGESLPGVFHLLRPNIDLRGALGSILFTGADRDGFICAFMEMDATSMASAAAFGTLAVILFLDATYKAMRQGVTRSNKAALVLAPHSKPFGLSVNYEGAQACRPCGFGTMRWSYETTASSAVPAARCILVPAWLGWPTFGPAREAAERERLPSTWRTARSVTSTDAPRRDLRGSMRFCTLVTLDS